MNRRTPPAAVNGAIELPLADQPTPHERRDMLIEAVKDFDAKIKPEAPAELVDRMVAEGTISLRANDDDVEERGATAPPDDVAAIPMQYGIQAWGVVGGGVELRQESQHGGFDDPDADSIAVTASNVVELARKILTAAGFPNVEITAGPRSEEILDGQTPAQFDFTPPVPYVRPPTLTPTATPPPEDDPPFDWDSTAVFDTQLRTAVYESVGNRLAIRQDPFDIHDADDTVITVTLPHIKSFIDRLNAVAKEILAGGQQ